jgi:thymidylate synthase (FAD)
MKVTYIEHMGDDLRIANAARVSFGKSSEELTEQDIRLIHYLERHNHFTPSCHCFLSVHIKAPLFVARQLVKHQVGLVWNEISRRYVDSEPEFYWPEQWRARAADKKQGSSNEPVKAEWLEEGKATFEKDILRIYNDMLAVGVCPEQARMILPLNTYTEWWWSGSLAAFARVCDLRLAPDAQRETAEIAQQIADICRKLFPNYCEAHSQKGV